jgi:hypothetical protein
MEIDLELTESKNAVEPRKPAPVTKLKKHPINAPKGKEHVGMTITLRSSYAPYQRCGQMLVIVDMSAAGHPTFDVVATLFPHRVGSASHSNGRDKVFARMDNLSPCQSPAVMDIKLIEEQGEVNGKYRVVFCNGDVLDDWRTLVVDHLPLSFLNQDTRLRFEAFIDRPFRQMQTKAAKPSPKSTASVQKSAWKAKQPALGSIFERAGVALETVLEHTK